MTDWRISYVARALKAALPFKHQLRAWRAKVSPPAPREYHLKVIEGAAKQVRALRDLGFALEGKTAREIGSGWFPIMPLIYRLAGTEHVYLSDVQPLFSGPNIIATLRFLRAHKAKVLEETGASDARFESVLGAQESEDYDAVLAALKLSYVIIGRDPIPASDVIFSHTTLEHIAPDLLKRVFIEARAQLRPGGVMSHGVDHTDHRSHSDPNLSPIDFLRYSDSAWKLLCFNPLDYTSRLRHSDYVALFAETGYELLYQRAEPWARMAGDARRLPLWGRFRAMSEEDAAACWSHFVARPKPAR